MKIALIGATGFVGAAVLTELIDRDHQVTAIVRDPAKALPAGVAVAVADAFDAAAIAAAVAGVDAVISAFNPGWDAPDLYDKFLRGSAAIEQGVAASGVKRLLVVGGAGSLFVAPGVQLVDTASFTDHVPAKVVPGARAARDALIRLQGDTQLDWTFISPPAMLAPGARSGAYRLGADELLMDGDGDDRTPAGISVADLAVAIVDDIERPRHLRARFTVASAA